MALLLDGLLLFPVFFVGFFLAGALADDDGDPSAASITVLIVTLVASYALHLWNRCTRAGRTGQSMGRQVMDIWLLEESTGRPMGAWPAFARELLHILDAFCYIGYIYAAVDSKTQTFADKIMHTVVVSR